MALLEVLISAMLVALISIALVTGFAGATRATSDARSHAQAVLCAQQDEERLRGMSEVQLSEMTYSPETPRKLTENCQEWKAGDTGTTFTLRTTATYVTAATGEDTTCTITGSRADYIRTTSSVTWPALGKRPPVTESSIVTTPDGASLIVKITNQNDEPVPGATVSVSQVNGSEVNVTRVTGPEGCLVFGSLPDSELKVTAERPGYVTTNGSSKFEHIVTVETGSTTPEVEVALAEAGSLDVKFVSDGTQVTGDTFVASQESISASHTFDVGGTPNDYFSEVKLSGLYPFASPLPPPSAGNPQVYNVYAGECEANNPQTVSGAALPGAAVQPGQTTSVTVEVPPLNLTVYEGKTPSGAALKDATVKIRNTACEGVTPNYPDVAATVERVQETGPLGTLARTQMPYGKSFAICVSAKLTETITRTEGSGTHERTVTEDKTEYHIYKSTFAITEPKGATLAVALEATGPEHTTSTTSGC